MATPRSSRLSNSTWWILGASAFLLCLLLSSLWAYYGFCIPCELENTWNGLQTWVKTGVCPFW